MDRQQRKSKKLSRDGSINGHTRSDMASDSGMGQDDTSDLVATTGDDVVFGADEPEVVVTITEQEASSTVVAPSRALDAELIEILDRVAKRSILVVNNEDDYETLRCELSQNNPKFIQVILKTTSKFRCRIASR